LPVLSERWEQYFFRIWTLLLIAARGSFWPPSTVSVADFFHSISV